MAGTPVTSVIYDDGNDEQFALVRSVGEGSKLNLIVFTDDGPAFKNGVPRNDEGGGVTWRPSK